jgi:hypothetical protein
MPNNLNVTLDETKTPWAVDVDQHGKDNEVGKSPNAQTIVWQLTGNAASGSFVSLSDPSPGFEWIDAPPAGIFSSPSRSPNGNQLTITDTNNNANTEGSWTYRLRVNVGGTVYSTNTASLQSSQEPAASTPRNSGGGIKASASMVTTDPWIRNK